MSIDKHKLRLTDFERRAAFALDSVFLHRTRGWRYIPVHSFSEEVTHDVLSADCWCLIDGDAALLECWKTSPAHLQPGLYARVEDDEDLSWPKLLGVTPQNLTRDVVEAMMERFAVHGFPEPLLESLHPGGSYVKISDWP